MVTDRAGHLGCILSF